MGLRGICVIILALAFFVGTGIIGFMMFDQLNTVYASGPGTRVLVLVDANTQGTTDLVDALVTAGNTVTPRAIPEFTWDGTNPSLDDFDVVIHLNGAWPSRSLPVSGQTALVDFVRNGGGFISGQFNGLELAEGRQTSMNDLVLQLWPFPDNCPGCFMTWKVVSGQESHPVLAGIPPSFTFFADGHDAGSLVVFSTDPSTVLMRAPVGPAVIVREFENGRVVSFSHAANAFLRGETLQDSNIQQLYVNAVDWTCDCSDTTPPEITASLVPICGEDDEGFFTVEFSATDNTDPSPTVTATLNGITVTNGQRVELDIDLLEEESKFEGTVLKIEGSSFTLVVSASDSEGNSDSVEVIPSFDDLVECEELEGIITEFSGTSFTLETEDDGTFTITTDGFTQFEDVAEFSDLMVGDEVEVEGAPTNDGLLATEIELEEKKDKKDKDDDEDEDDDDEEDDEED